MMSEHTHMIFSTSIYNLLDQILTPYLNEGGNEYPSNDIILPKFPFISYSYFILSTVTDSH